jgi:hypothetical protein
MGNILILLFKNFLLQRTIIEAKKTGFLIYIKTLQVARKSLAGALLVFVLLQFLVSGFFGAVISIIFLLPNDLETKLYLLLILCTGIFAMTLLGFIYVMSERVWYKAAKVDALLEELN